jgi:YesN/AraC family two-component response regulator
MKGLEILNEIPEIKVVISDMKMPSMNGIEFIKKAKESHPNIKFYILTGFEITEEIQAAINSKLIIKYYMKPFSMNDLDTAIMDAIG